MQDNIATIIFSVFSQCIRGEEETQQLEYISRIVFLCVLQHLYMGSTLCLWHTILSHMWSWSKGTVSSVCLHEGWYFFHGTAHLWFDSAWESVPLFQRVCMWRLHVKPVSEGRGAWASGAAENLSPSCQAAFKVFSSCSSGCSQPRPHPHVSHRYVTVPAGRTKGTHGDSDRHWMIQSGRTEGKREQRREGGMERKKERERQAERKDRDQHES